VQEYDVALKSVLGSAEAALRELTGVAVRRWLNVELPEVQATRVDLLGESDVGELVHIEHPDMPLRMAEYCLRVYRQFGRFPRQVLLYVGEPPLTMSDALVGLHLDFRYRVVDIRQLDGEQLLDSTRLSDNVIAILAQWRDQAAAVRRLVARIAGLAAAERSKALKQLMILAGLRHLGAVVEQEVKKMPILNSILDHEVLGREYKKGLDDGRKEGVRQGVKQGVKQGLQRGELTVLRRQIEKRFGPLPAGALRKLSARSAAELEELSVRVLDARSIEELLA
jgi:hypothetical protein